MALWALVTGASEGLGREFAILAAKSGFDVILTARQHAKLEALAGQLKRAYHVDVVILPADLSDPEQVETMWRDAVKGREIAVLVNNAGLGANGDFADAAMWEREETSIMVNICAATVLMKQAAGHMRANGTGRILNVASLAGFMPGPHMAVYYATKAYLLSLSEAAASELAGSGVSVTALCPGATQTQFFEAGGFAKGTLLTMMPMPTAESVAAAGWKGMEQGKRIVVPGVMNKISAFMPRILPRRLMAATSGLISRRRG